MATSSTPARTEEAAANNSGSQSQDSAEQGGNRVPGTPWLGYVLGTVVGLLIVFLMFYFGPSALNALFTSKEKVTEQPQQQADLQAITDSLKKMNERLDKMDASKQQPAPATAPEPTQVAPGTTPVIPGTTPVVPGGTVVAPGAVQTVPGTQYLAVDPAVVATYATSTVAKDDATHVTVRKHKDNDEVIFVGPGKHLPRKIIVQSCPQVAPIQVNVPVPSVENQIFLPQLPVPPTTPTTPAAPVLPNVPFTPVVPQGQQTSYVAPAPQEAPPVCHGQQPVRRVMQRNYGN